MADLLEEGYRTDATGTSQGKHKPRFCFLNTSHTEPEQRLLFRRHALVPYKLPQDYQIQKLRNKINICTSI
jgi:hypothetical protein